MKKDGFRCDPPIKLSSWWWRRFCVASDPSSCVHRRRDFARRRFFPEQRFFAEEALSRWSFVLLLKMVAPLNFVFSLSYTSHLILRFCLTDGVVGFFRLLLPVIFFLYEYFFTPMPRRVSNPRQSVELHQTGTFRTLYRLSYSAAANFQIKLIWNIDAEKKWPNQN